MPAFTIHDLRTIWKAGPDYLSESRFNRLKELEGMNLIGPNSTINTYRADWESYWGTYTGLDSAADYAAQCPKMSILRDLGREYTNGTITRNDLEMYRRLGGRSLQTWEEYKQFITIAKYCDEVGKPSFTEKKFNQLYDLEMKRRVHTKDRLFSYYKNWADYCSHHGTAKGAVSGAAGGEGGMAPGKKAAGTRARALFLTPSRPAPSAPVVVDAPSDDDVMADWIDGPASAVAQGDDGEDGSSFFADDPEGGLGMPARVADMMSMLHVRLLSLEVGLRGRNRYRCE
jgi:hypothetical protein